MKLSKCGIGFYVDAKDKNRNTIYEVMKNEQFKDNPEEHEYLVDEWNYDETDLNDIKHYRTTGNLVSREYYDDIDVVKIVDTTYKVYGNCGAYLKEDKPTYKELFFDLQKRMLKMLEVFQKEISFYQKELEYYRQRYGD